MADRFLIIIIFIIMKPVLLFLNTNISEMVMNMEKKYFLNAQKLAREKFSGENVRSLLRYGVIQFVLPLWGILLIPT